MSNIPLKIQLPIFKVSFDNNNSYTISTTTGKENLKKLLYKTSRGYCMYCYTRILIDNKMVGHLEHAIEKNLSIKYLTTCTPNIGVSCPTCNDKFKKYQEKQRKVKETVIDTFEKTVSCNKNCTTPCSPYLKLKEHYLNNAYAHIVLQPLGVVGKESGNPFILQYDILNTKFEPSQKYTYTEHEIQFMEDHIALFHLNDKEFKTKQLLNFLETTINAQGIYPRTEYNNMIVQLFIEQILLGKSEKEILKICETIYTYSVLKFSI